MSKQLRIPVNITLPDDLFAQVEVMSKIKPALVTFLATVKLITPDFSADMTIVTTKAREAKPVAVVHAPVLVDDSPLLGKRHAAA